MTQNISSALGCYSADWLHSGYRNQRTGLGEGRGMFTQAGVTTANSLQQTRFIYTPQSLFRVEEVAISEVCVCNSSL